MLNLEVQKRVKVLKARVSKVGIRTLDLTTGRVVNFTIQIFGSNKSRSQQHVWLFMFNEKQKIIKLCIKNK